MSHLRTQKTIHPAIATVVNVGLWPIKAWGLSQDELDGSEIPTGHLCTVHIVAAIMLIFTSSIVGTSLVITEFLSITTVVVGTIALYLILGTNLRYQVGRRCRAQFPNYNYIRANLDVLQ